MITFSRSLKDKKYLVLANTLNLKKAGFHYAADLLVEFKSVSESHSKIHDRGEDVCVERTQNVNRRGWRLGSKKDDLSLALVEVEDVFAQPGFDLCQAVHQLL